MAGHAFRSTPNGQPVVLTDLGTLGGLFSEAFGINDSAVVVGASDSPGGRRAFRTAPNSVINPAVKSLVGGLTVAPSRLSSGSRAAVQRGDSAAHQHGWVERVQRVERRDPGEIQTLPERRPNLPDAACDNLARAHRH